ncbi:gamma-glutamyl-gamma-aminobutyrate hydrolase family protein [Peribacillus deserti]|uniref:Gamma-glutamyl-gamma-aminobutyrate hydrolase n=1 Tax=Peribacillus deserti TaxID=673318 RepID=A0A2N5M2S3_9BACI|nr:gamma-glutamyl-gamma-aminobutyrate hydrolase family protein [Peribacillus deserti]PLT28573.1 gamma-glutamyl-gamma-aminobutyrate hydrolase [Peribacillus deserti]
MSNKKPIIGITATTMFTSGFDSVYLHYSYVDSVIRAGGIPVVLPIGNKELAQEWVSLCDGILLSGGEDIDPYHFGAEPHPRLGRVVPERDQTELDLIEYARKKKLPIFGICRGIQVLNVALGGNLIQDIESERMEYIKHAQQAARAASSHTIAIEQDSLLGRISGKDSIRVNSFHHQAIGDVASSLKIGAVSKDGIIEAVEAADPDGGWMLAVQWHPEDMAAGDEIMHQLFVSFIEACSE